MSTACYTTYVATDVITGVECGHMRLVLRGIKKSESLTARTRNYCSLVEYAYYMSDLNMMRLLLLHKSPVTSTTSTPLLHRAVSSGRVEYVQEFLVDNRADPNEIDAKRLTALAYTGHSNSSELISALLDAGCNIQLGTDGLSVLHET